MKLLSIRNLTVVYGNYKALNDVNLDVYHDDLLGVIGPNGGGKTTLVKSIMGTVEYRGEIHYDPVLGKRRNCGKLIGYLPQQSNIDRKFPISVLEVVLSGLQSNKTFRKTYSRADKSRALELLERTGILDIAGNQIGEVSGGQMQRTLLCRAIISDPKLLILDEPANFVDNKFESELYEILKILNERMAIIMVSHDMGTITSIVKSIVCVNRNVHRHDSNIITSEQLENYGCPIKLLSHGEIPHTILGKH